MRDTILAAIASGVSVVQSSVVTGHPLACRSTTAWTGRRDLPHRHARGVRAAAQALGEPVVQQARCS
ncbi:MAG: hypothetical protein M3Q75_05610 [Gemmatimonadota bacterium]|nr:hypothetical protein [Gemmatimonadota bacterium]